MPSIRVLTVGVLLASATVMGGCATLFGGGGSQSITMAAAPTTVNYVIQSPPWPDSARMGGRIQSESVAGLRRNTQPPLPRHWASSASLLVYCER